WTATISDMFPIAKRGRIFGVRGMFSGLSMLLATFAAGRLLDALPSPFNFTATFLIAAAIAGVATLFLARLEPPDPAPAPGIGTDAAQAAPNRPAPAEPDTRPLAFFREGSGRALLKLALPTALFNLGFILAGPIVNIYYVDILLLTNTEIGLLASAFLLFQVVGSPLWGNIADRAGNHAVLTWATLGLAVQAAAFLLVPSVPYLVLMQAVGGLSYAGFLLGSFNVLIGTGASHERTR